MIRLEHAAKTFGMGEVEVRAPLDIPLDPKKTGFKNLSITTIDAEGAKLKAVSTGGSNYDGHVLADPGMLVFVRFDRLQINALGVDKGVAVLRLSVT